MPSLPSTLAVPYPDLYTLSPHVILLWHLSPQRTQKRGEDTVGECVCMCVCVLLCTLHKHKVYVRINNVWNIINTTNVLTSLQRSHTHTHARVRYVPRWWRCWWWLSCCYYYRHHRYHHHHHHLLGTLPRNELQLRSTSRERPAARICLMDRVLMCPTTVPVGNGTFRRCRFGAVIPTTVHSVML